MSRELMEELVNEKIFSSNISEKEEKFILKKLNKSAAMDNLVITNNSGTVMNNGTPKEISVSEAYLMADGNVATSVNQIRQCKALFCKRLVADSEYCKKHNFLNSLWKATLRPVFMVKVPR